MKSILRPFVLLLSLALGLVTSAQVVNGYARVTSVAGKTLSLSTVSESFDTFEDGEQIIIMQMQDDVIGANTADNSSFGNLGSIANAGVYEVVTIDSHAESAGTPTSITLTASPTATFNTGSNSSVQIITFPRFGAHNYTTTSDMEALAWNGNIGGVLAFQVSGTLTLLHDLDASEAGFRGASANGGGSTGCTGGSNYRVIAGANYANKGEGIYRVTNPNYEAGRAHLLNGGGGGNSHNAGGGGGSNYTAGGLGGPGWPNCSPSAGGIGGLNLSSNIDAGRVFMGGGGGAGEGNDGGSPTAANGGGIILIKAGGLRTAGGTPVTIAANGGSVTAGSGGDGNSGGGAGGSIVFEVASWSVAAGAPLTVSADGGNGGSVNHNDIHGAGGGGGMGAVIYSTTTPVTNITTNTTPGMGGANCFSCGFAADGNGSNGDGIIDQSSGALPIELLSFEAREVNHKVALRWTTATELNNDFFTVERSWNGTEWQTVDYVTGAGNSSYELNYSTWDNTPFNGVSYYRLKQTDFDGQFSYSDIVPVNLESDISAAIKAYPNPSDGLVTIEGLAADLDALFITDLSGRVVTQSVQLMRNGSSEMQLDLRGLDTGLYLLHFNSSTIKVSKR